jgi:alkanesulfonate monooxygenase SsuD/methylene tetrahydromethanopterin reductase-like flavin-dependent oxidoreductase (luciferase family)
MMRNTPTQLQPPIKNLDELMSPYEKAVLEKQLCSAIIGSPIIVKKKLQSFLDETKADEIMVITMVYDHNARLYSHQLVAEIIGL